MFRIFSFSCNSHIFYHYRKNPAHFKEYSHPSKDGDDEDEDDKAAAEDSDDDRPECPYGTGCYRRNPQHKQDFKHTGSPGEQPIGHSSNEYMKDHIFELRRKI